MRKVLIAIAALFILAGTICLSFPFVKECVKSAENKKKIKEFHNSEEPKEEDPLYQSFAAYNARILSEGQSGLSDAWSFEQEQIKNVLPENDMAGYITIEAMDISLPLYIGADEDNLMNGAAVLANTSMPIGGESTNCVIAGHRGGYNGQAVFRDIEVLSPGDIVSLTNSWETLEYEVIKSIVIMSDDIDAIKIIPGEDMLTLVTCHPYGDNTQRYVVYCARSGSEAEERIEIKDGIPFSSSIREIELERNLFRIGICAAGIVFVLLIVGLVRRK